ncbi:PaaI family thioesterase [Edaphobacter modestus]|nr:PaaI family thioesterase [Edaphobacter modestus]
MMAVLGAKDSYCYVCGPDNKFGLRVPFEQDGAESSCARYVARPEHGGWNGVLHGGVTFSLMDEALGWALFFQQKPAVTAKIRTRFTKPVPIGAALLIRAWVIRERSRIVEAKAEVRSDDGEMLFAEAEATMFRIPAAPAIQNHSEEEAIA